MIFLCVDVDHRPKNQSYEVIYVDKKFWTWSDLICDLHISAFWWYFLPPDDGAGVVPGKNSHHSNSERKPRNCVTFYYHGIRVSSTWDRWRRYRRCHHGSHSLHTWCSGHVASRGCTCKNDLELYEPVYPLCPPCSLTYQLQSSSWLQASMQSSTWDMGKESTKWP